MAGAGGPASAEGVGGVADQGGPDEGEGDDAGGRDRLAVDEGEDHLAGGGDVLEDADGGEAEASRGGGEPDERGDGHEAGDEHEGALRGGGGGEGVGVGGDEEGVGGEGEGEGEEEFDRQADERARVDLLADEAVAGEGEHEDQGDPWECAPLDRGECDGGGGEGDTDPFEAAEALAEEDHAQRDGDERRRVIAEARVHEAVGRDGVDEGGPVGEDEDGREGQEREDAGRAQCAEEIGHGAAEGEEDEDGGQAEDDALEEELEGGSVDGGEIDGFDDSPPEEGGEAEGEADAGGVIGGCWQGTDGRGEGDCGRGCNSGAPVALSSYSREVRMRFRGRVCCSGYGCEVDRPERLPKLALPRRREAMTNHGSMMCLTALVCLVLLSAPRADAQCSLVEIASQELLPTANGLFQSGDYTLMALGGSGLAIVDEVVSGSPRLLGRLEFAEGPAWRVVADGDTAFVIADRYLVSVDISERGAPVWIDSVHLGTAVSADVDMALAGGHVYIAIAHATDGRLKIVDVSDPGDLSIVHQRTTADPARGVAVFGSLCFVATDSEDASLVLSVSSPASPVLLADDAPGGTAVALAAGVAYLASDSGLYSLDMSDPADPEILDIAPTNDVYRMKLQGDRLFLQSPTDYDGACDDPRTTFRQVDVSDPEDLRVLHERAGNYGTGIGDFSLAGDELIFPLPGKGLTVWSTNEGEATRDALISAEIYRTQRQGHLVFGLTPWWPAPSTDETGFVAMELSDPLRPRYLGVVTVPFNVRDFALGDGIAVLTGVWTDFADCDKIMDSYRQIAIIDIRDEHDLRVVYSRRDEDRSGYRSSGGISEDGFLYLPIDDFVEVWDLADVESPELVATLPVSALAVAVEDDTLFLSEADQAVAAYDITNRLSPVEVARSVGGTAGALLVDMERGVVFSGSIAQLTVLRSSDLAVLGVLPWPAGAEHVRSIQPFGDALGVWMNEFFNAWISEPGVFGLVNVSDLSRPVLATEGLIDEFSGFIDGENELIYDHAAESILAVGAEAMVEVVGGASTAGTAFGVAYRDGLVFVSDYGGGIRIMDVTDRGAPIEIGSYQNGFLAYEAVVLGDLAFVAFGEAGLVVLDVSIPESPTVVGSLVTPDRALGVAVEGDTAFVASRFEGVQVIDISDPTSPALVGAIDTAGSAQGISIAGMLAYVADGTAGVHVIDVSNRAAPSIVSSYATPGSAREVHLRGVTAFVADGPTGLIALDASDPADLRLIGSLGGVGEVRSVTTRGVHAFVADFGGWVHVVNITDPEAMLLEQSVATLGTGREIVHDGGTLFLADGDAGLTVLESRPCWYDGCPADIMSDGFLDFFDVQAFLNAYSDSEGLADWNDDGMIDFFDVLSFVSDFSAGCP